MNRDEIETLAREAAAARRELAEVLDTQARAMAQVRRRFDRRVARLTEIAAEAKAELHNATSANPALFDSPRSMVVDGLKFGWRQQKGRKDIPDMERSVALADEHLNEDQHALIIRERREIDKNAIADLDDASLRLIGVRIVDNHDEPFVRDTQGGKVDKLIDALIQEVLDE